MRDELIKVEFIKEKKWSVLIEKPLILSLIPFVICPDLLSIAVI